MSPGSSEHIPDEPFPRAFVVTVRTEPRPPSGGRRRVSPRSFRDDKPPIAPAVSMHGP